jgi:hypothetical protein
MRKKDRNWKSKVGKKVSGFRCRVSGNRILEVGSRTRRRPIERDYAAAKDAEVGKQTEDKGQKSENR